MTQIKVINGDITKLKVDAIVNAANSSLLGGLGVDGAIHKAGGKSILEACMEIRQRQGGCQTGEAVITTAGLLDAKFVIHTVGPVWSGSYDCSKLLESCYRNSLLLAIENKVKTIAFPNISTGIYRFPKYEAAKIAIKAVKDFIHSNNDLDEIIFVCFDEENYKIYMELLK